MKYAIMIGSNMFIGTNGVLTVELNGVSKEFFRIREIYRARSEGSYLAVDCDIKDNDNSREIKLFKNNPVVIDANITVEVDKTKTTAKRSNGSTIIEVEQLDSNHESLPKSGPIKDFLINNPLDAVLRITGDFYAGGNKLYADSSKLMIGTNTISGNLMIGTGGLLLTQGGFAI